MRILLINHYAGSPRHGMEYRPFYLAREWVRSGHTVQIIAATQSHVRALQPKDANNELIDGVAYRWLATPAYSGNGIGRVLNIVTFLARLWHLAPALAADFKPDVVIASSTYPMDIWVAHRIAKLTCKQGTPSRLVFEVHDLWPLSPIELGGMSPRHPFIMLCQTAENDAYRHADVVVSLLPKVAQHMQSRGLDLRKLRIVPNGVDPDEWALAEPLPPELVAQFAVWQNQGEKIVGYAGSHGLANALDDLLDAARLMRDDKLRFVLVGTGPEKERLWQYARNMGLDNVSFLDPVRKAQIPALLKLFDIAYLGLQDQPLFRFGIAPNKLMDYMMATRPVLMAIRAGNDPVAESGCGITVPPANPQAITEGLRRLFALDMATRARMGALGRQFVLENHSYPVLAQRFLAAIEQRQDYD